MSTGQPENNNKGEDVMKVWGHMGGRTTGRLETGLCGGEVTLGQALGVWRLLREGKLLAPRPMGTDAGDRSSGARG